jgi:hypothetical protein
MIKTIFFNRSNVLLLRPGMEHALIITIERDSNFGTC